METVKYVLDLVVAFAAGYFTFPLVKLIKKAIVELKAVKQEWRQPKKKDEQDYPY